MKTDRERLITLLNDFVCTLASCDKPTCNECNADYLISKGVTIPVRCENCKHFDSIEENLPYRAGLCQRDNSYWFPWDFCSYGERREDDRAV